MSAPQIQYPPTSGGGTPVGGSGTTNTIPRWTGASTLGDSGLIDDSTSIYTSTRRVGVDTSTTLANVKFQIGSASALSNYQGAPFGVILPAGSGSWLEFAENSTNGTAFRITKDSNTGVILNANGKDIGFDAGAYESLISGCQMVLKTSGNVGIGTTTPASALHVRNNTAGITLDSTLGGGRQYQLNPLRTGLSNSGFEIRDVTAGAAVISIDASQQVGIGTASPIGTLDVRATNPTIVCSNSATRYGYQVWNDAASEYRAGTGGSFPFVFLTANTERARIDSSGRWYVGVSSVVVPASGSVWAIINQPGAAGGQEWHNSSASPGGAAIVPSQNRATWYVYQNAVGSEAYSQSCVFTPTGIDLTGASATPGLKLPATPGNADTQTLDAYKENTTWAPTVTWGTGGTVTTTSATGAYTQIGNVVTFTVTIAYNCSVIPTGGSITIDLPRTSATGFNQRPGLWAFNAWNGVAGSNFLSIGSASTTATLRVANATGTADIATYLTVTASGALVITATYLAS